MIKQLEQLTIGKTYTLYSTDKNKRNNSFYNGKKIYCGMEKDNYLFFTKDNFELSLGEVMNVTHIPSSFLQVIGESIIIVENDSNSLVVTGVDKSCSQKFRRLDELWGKSR